MADPVYLPQLGASNINLPRARSNTADLQAVSGLGDQVAQSSSIALDSEINLMSQSYVSDFYGRAASMFNEKKKSYDESGLGFSQSYMEDFDSELDSYIEEQKINPLIAPAVRRAIQPTRRQFIDQSLSYETSAAEEFTKRGLNSAADQIINQALTDPDSYPEQQERLNTILGDAKRVMSPEEYTSISERLTKSLDQSTLQGVINKDPQQAMMEIEEGIWADVDPGVLRDAYELAREKSQDNNVASLIAAASSNPIQFYRQASEGKFTDPELQSKWDGISEVERLDIATRSITLSNMMNSYVDSQQARRDKAISDASNDLKRMLYTSEDPAEMQELMNRIQILGTESGEGLRAIQDYVHNFEMEGGRDDPIVYENIIEDFVSGNYNTEPLDFVGTGLSRSTAVELSTRFKTAREGTYDEALRLIKDSVTLHEGFGSLGASESKKEAARLTKEFLTRVADNRDEDPMKIAKGMIDNYDVDKELKNRRNTLERRVIDAMAGLTVTEDTGFFGRDLPIPEGVTPNEDIPRREDGTVDTDELINRMNFYMMEGIISREEFVDGPMQAVRELKSFNERTAGE